MSQQRDRPNGEDVSAQALPGDKPALLTRADPASVTLSINTLALGGELFD